MGHKWFIWYGPYDMVMTLPSFQGINGSLPLINGPNCIRYGPYHNMDISTVQSVSTFKRTKRIFLNSCKLQLNLFCKCFSNPRDFYSLVRTPYHYELYGWPYFLLIWLFFLCVSSNKVCWCLYPYRRLCKSPPFKKP